MTCQGLRALALDLSPTNKVDASNLVARCDHLFNTLGEGVIVATGAGGVSSDQAEPGLRHLPLDPLAFPCRSASHLTAHLPLPNLSSRILMHTDVC